MQQIRLAIDGHEPQVAPDSFVAPTAVLVGDVAIASQVSIWYGCVLRGDSSPIRVGARSNIQELSVLHGAPNLPVELGEDVALGHGVILHGSRVGSGSLLGMGCVVLNGCEIGEGSVIAAGAVLSPGTVVPPESLVAGLPARVVRPVRDKDREMIARVVSTYVARVDKYRTAHGY